MRRTWWRRSKTRSPWICSPRRAKIGFAATTRTCGMPRTADPSAIRRILQTDRTWAVYALADLAPEYSAFARWHLAADGRPALLLVYRGFDPPVLFAHGAAADLAPLLPEIAAERAFYLSMRPEAAALLRANSYEIHDEKAMWRMVLDPV